jgi:hypothetical protein
MAGQCYTSFENIYSAGGKCVISATVDIFETHRKRGGAFAVLPLLPACVFSPRSTTSK